MFKEKSILVVDDDPDILILYKHFLGKEVGSITCLENPLEALERLKIQKFDLVISDILMPQMNGIDLTLKIHSLYPQLPILVCSEGGTTDAKEVVAGIVLKKAVEFGAVFALKKPFKKTELLDIVFAILEKRVDELYED